MRKILVVIILLTSNLSSFARQMTCLDKLLPFNRHSGLHQVTADELPSLKQLEIDNSEIALNFLINSKLLCRSGEVTIKIRPTCNPIITDLPQSNVCFAFTNLGYFVISKDNAKNVNFIFSRDKRFSEK